MDNLERILGDLPDPAWSTRGVCAQVDDDGTPVHDPDLWFPEDGQWTRAQAAKELCTTCPVQDECRQFAINTGQRYGVWGGLAAGQRRQKVPA